MPLYQVHHSHPLSSSQKHDLAQRITNLHAHKFTTPSFFVHVKFIAEDGNDSYFLAGKPHAANANRVVGVVRTSASRTKADFDALGEEIEKAWYDVVDGKGRTVGDLNKEGKRLVMVVFTPMITIREGGMAIPDAGKEGEWLKQHLPHIKEMADKEGIEDFQEMIEEVQSREDLKSWLQDS
ncbi:hypothetical protein CAC42_851 [Sphaceloma murrayae]|uniref:Tautomerase cis-CaaD-like domain-containing protein n=1 Tax=Sphaceloma murrayae TaxID=2082308 RepID=A0A2K1QKX7_9PEZI|nr:hypothetical protein CAC42_851 [Sphaceloma murrayae]